MSSQEAVDYCHDRIIMHSTLEMKNIMNNKPKSNNSKNQQQQQHQHHRHQQKSSRDISSKGLTSIKQSMAKYLVKEALLRGSMDNISVVVVWLSSSLSSLSSS